MGISIPNFSLRSLADYGAFTPQQGVQGIQQTFMPQTLADVARMAQQGDYRGASAAALNGGNTDVAEKMLATGLDERDKIAQTASSFAQQASTPQAWANADQALKTMYGPGASMGDFPQRDAMIAGGITGEEGIQNKLKQEDLANDRLRSAAMLAPYAAAGFDLSGLPGMGGMGALNMGGGAASVPAPTDGGGQPNPGANRTIYNSPVSTILASLPDADTPSPKLGGLSANGLKTKVDTYFTNGGNIQGLGMGSGPIQSVQRTAIMNSAGETAAKLGLTVPEMTAAYKANSSGATQITNRVARIDTTANTVAAQFPRLQQLADRVSNMGIQESDLTAGKAAFMRKFGSPDAAAYYDLIQTIRGDYAAMQAAIAGGRGGLGYVENAKEAIPVGLSSAQYAAIGDQIGKSAANARAASGDQIRNLIYGSTSPNAATGGAEAAPAPSAAPRPGDVEDGYRFKGGDPSVQSNWEAVP